MRRFALVVLATVGLLAAAGRAPAQTYTWNPTTGTGAGTWDTTTANWLLGGAQTTYANGPNTAVFGNRATAASAVAVAAGGVTAGTVSFADTGAFAYTVGSTGTTVTLDAGGAADAALTVGRGVVGTGTYSGSGGQTFVNSSLLFFNNLVVTNNGAVGTTSLTLASPLDRNAAGGQVLLTGAGQTLVSGAIGGTVTGGVVKSGTGTAVLSGATNAFAGGVTVNGGVLGILSNDLMLGNAANGVTINAGGTFRFNNTVSSPRAFTVTGTAASPSGLDLSSGVTATLTGNSATTGLVGSGTARVSVTGGTTAGTLSVEGAQTGFTGNLVVGAPGLQVVGSVAAQRPAGGVPATVRLQNAGALPTVAGLTLNPGGTLAVVNGTTAPAQNLPDRFPDAAPITSHSGRLTFTGPDAVAASETLGPITATGYTVVTATNEFQTITLGAISRADRAGLFVRGAFGGAAPSSTVNNLFVAGGLPNSFVPTDPTGVNGPASGAGTGQLTGIVPFVGVNTNPTLNDPRSFATYDPATGLRTLLQTDTNFFAQVGAGGTMPDFANIHLTAAPAALTGTKIINSLAVSTTATIGGTGTLRISSGAIATFNTFTFNGPTVDFGPATGYFHSGFGMNVAGGSSLTGSGGFSAGALNGTASYRVAFTNTVPNPFTGGLSVNGGVQVAFQRDDQLGAIGAGNGLTLGGGQLLFIPTAAGTVALDATRTVTVGPANGTIGTQFATGVLEIPGLISGPGQLQFGGGVGALAGNAGTVRLTNPSANTYTGGTVVGLGTLSLTNPNQLGTGAVYLNGGTLQAGANLGFAAAPIVVSGSTIDTQANTVTLGGGLAGSGGILGNTALTATLTKTGTGTLAVAGGSTFAGPLTLSTTDAAGGGTVTLSGAGAAPELGTVTLGRGTTFNVDDSAGGPLQRTGRTTNLTLTNTGGTATAGGAVVNLTAQAGGGSRFTFGTLSAAGGASGTANTSTLNLIDGGSGNNVVSFLGLTGVSANNLLNLVGTTNFGIDIGPSTGTRLFFQNAPALTGGAIPNVTFSGFGGSGAATYDSQLGVLLLQSVSGTFIDNVVNVGPGSITPTGAVFTTTGATTANLGATIKSLAIDGHTVTLVPNVRTPQAANANAPADTLVITGGGLTTSTAASTITSGSPARVQFGVNAAVFANTDLTVGANVTLAGTAGLTKSGTGVLTVSGPNQLGGVYTIAAGTVNLNTAATIGGLAGVTGTTVNLVAGQPLVLGGTANSTYSGVLGGAGTVSLPAGFTGQQTLSGANTFAGAFTVAGGTLVAGSASALGATNASTVTVGSGGTLGFSGAVIINAQPVSVAGVGASGRFGAIDNIAGANTFDGPITLTGPATIGATTGSLTLGGAITTGGNAVAFAPQSGTTINLNPAAPVALNLGTAQLTVSGTGNGLLVLPNTTNTIGSTAVTGGTVQVADIPTNLGGGPVTLNGGGLTYTGPSVALTSAQTPTVGPNGGTLTVTTAASTVTFGNATWYNGPFTKDGPGTVLLQATTNLTPSQPLSVARGTLDTNGSSLTVTTLTLGTAGAPTAPALVTAGTSKVTLGGNLVFNAPATPTVPISANLDLGGADRQFIGNGFTTAAAADVVFSGVISGTGGIVVTPGVGLQSFMAFTGANTFTGGFTHNSAGSMFLAAENTFQPTTPVVIGGAGSVNLVVGTAEGGLVVGSYNQTIGSLSSGGTGTGAMNLGAATLTVGTNNTSTTFASPVAGTGGALTKVGTGTLTLAGVNTYTGATTVNAGTLRVGAGGTGSTAALSAVTVNAGGTIGGSGTINGSLSVAAGGGLAPGNSIGTLTVNNAVTVAGGGAGPATTVWTVELNGVAPNSAATAEASPTNVDRLVVTGTGNGLTFLADPSNRIRIDLTQLGGTFTNGTSRVYYEIAVVTGGGTIAGFSAGNFEFSGPLAGPGSNPMIELNGASTTLIVSFVPVPEPATVLAVAAAGLGGLRLARRRRATA